MPGAKEITSASIPTDSVIDFSYPFRENIKYIHNEGEYQGYG